MTLSAIGTIQDKGQLFAGYIGFFFLFGTVNLGNLEPLPQTALLGPLANDGPNIVENIHLSRPFFPHYDGPMMRDPARFVNVVLELKSQVKTGMIHGA